MLFLLQLLLLGDPIDYRRNLNDVSSAFTSRAIPLGAVKAILALPSWYAGREGHNVIEVNMRIAYKTLGGSSLAHARSSICCFNVYEVSGDLILISVAEGLLAFTGSCSTMLTMHSVPHNQDLLLCKHILKHKNDAQISKKSVSSSAAHLRCIIIIFLVLL